MLPWTMSTPAFLLSTFIFIFSAVFLFLKKNTDDLKQPPGPRPLPLIGHLHMLGPILHRSLHSLSKKYGPIMSLRLGQVPAIVISSPEAAEQFLKTHDTIFANRPKFQASDYLFYGSRGMVFTPYGAYWRSLRKLFTIQLLSASKVESFGPQRMKKVGLLVESLEKAAVAGEVVDLSKMLENFVEDLMFKMIFGYERVDKFDLRGLVHEALTLLGELNLADFVPWLGVFDIQGITRRLKKTSKALDEVVEVILKEHEKDPSAQRKDFVGILLSLMDQPLDSHDQHVVDRTNVKGILLDMVFGSLETSTTVIDVTFAELLRHPRVMKNLQDELKDIIGLNKIVEQADLSKLSYLDIVVKEILRLYPIAPLLVPRISSEDITIDDYYIKKNSRIIVNAWAIGRDSKLWSDNAEEFYPERFINNKIDLRGQDFQLIPFGSGRRICPGMHLGLTTVKFILAQLLHCFNWELSHDLSPNDLDMNDKFGPNMLKRKHLMVSPSCRLLKEAYNGFN